MRRNPQVEGMPEVGVYYWVPLMTGWLLYADKSPGADHNTYWKAEIVPRIARDWGLSAKQMAVLRDHPRGIPRGRVTAGGGIYAILHGKDAPKGCSLADVVTEFGLAHSVETGLAVAAYHPHETMVAEDRRIVRKVLGRLPK